MKLIDQYIESLFAYFRDQIKKLESKKNIKREYYSRNLDLYMKLIGMTNPKEIAATRYLFLQSVNGFYYGLKDNYNKTNIMRYCDINDKELQELVVS